jgi:hypothetical protein
LFPLNFTKMWFSKSLGRPTAHNTAFTKLAKMKVI